MLMTTLSWQHAKVKSTKSNPPRNLPSFNSCQGHKLSRNQRKFSAHQIANDKTIMLSIENVQKVHSRPKLQGLNSCCRHKLGRNSIFFGVHQIPNDQTIILSIENIQQVHSRPKLWGFEKWCGKIGQNALTVALFEQLPQG